MVTEHEEERERIRLLNLRPAATKARCYEFPSSALAGIWKAVATKKADRA